MQRWRRSLVTRFVIFSLLLSFVTVSAIIGMVYHRTQQNIRQSYLEQLHTIVTLKGAALNRWLENQQQTAIFLSQLPTIRQQVSLIQAAPNTETTAAFATLSSMLNTAVANNSNLTGLFILAAADGQVLGVTEALQRVEHHLTTLYFEEAQQTTIIYPVHPDPVADTPVMAIVTPLFDETGTDPLGFIGMRLNLAQVDTILHESHALSDFSDLYLVNTQPTFVSSQQFGREQFPGNIQAAGIDMALQGINDRSAYDNYAGEPVLGAYQWLEAYQLALLAEMPLSRVPVPAGSFIWRIFLIMLIAVSIFGGGVYLLIRQMMHRTTQLYTAEQDRRRLAESLEQTGRILSGTLNLSAVTEQILKQLALVVPYNRGALLLQKKNNLQIIASQGFPSQINPTQLVVPFRTQADDVYYEIVQSGRPSLIDDVSLAPGWQQIDSLPLDHSWLGVPLITKDKVIGMVSLTRQERGAFNAQDATIAMAFAGQAAIALENASLYDEITHFNEQLEQRVQERTEELNKMYRILERLDKTKSDFISVTSHELRTPLSLMKGYTQILQEDLETGNFDRVEQLVRGILAGQKRMERLVDKMLDVASIHLIDVDDTYDPVPIAGLVERVYFSFEKTLQKRHLHFTTHNLEALPLVRVNLTLLVKAFEQLFENAIKYTPDGGSITVTGQLVTHDEDKQWVELVVRDTGIGINKEHHDLIFEKFYRTGEASLHSSSSTKFKGGGPGVGLTIVRGVVEAHNGRVWVESEGYDEEQYPGSAFHIALPYQPAS